MDKIAYWQLETFTRNPNYRVNSEWRYLEHILARWLDEKGCGKTARLDLNPDFQRAHVWTKEQQTAYVEYVLRGGRSGMELYFNCVGWMGTFKGPFVIVDGKQRLEAARAFMRDEVPVFGGYRCSEIKGKLPMHAQFVMCVNDLATRAEVLKWYLEMNTGGTPHTPEEISRVKQLLQEESK